MKKTEALRRWADLTPDQPIIPHFKALSADSKGSTFGANQIRITGSPDFVDAVLSHLKEVISLEAGSTRLDFSIASVKPVFDKQWANAETDAEVCYIKVKERNALTRSRRNKRNTSPLPGLALADGASNPPAKEVAAPASENEDDEDNRQPARQVFFALDEESEGETEG